MTPKIVRVLQEIREGRNRDLYVTILLAIVIALLGIIGVASFEILSETVQEKSHSVGGPHPGEN
jgi:hypothetical protein